MTVARTTTPPSRVLRTALLPTLAVGLLLGLSACTTPSPAPGTTAAAVTVVDPWVKAVDDGMTGVFGTLANDSDAEVVIVSAESSVSAVAELHEVAANEAGDMVMMPKEGGFVVPAGGTHELAPGADHIMLMDVDGPLEPGTEVIVTLTTTDGATITFTAPARSYTGANETYEGDDTEDDMGGHPSTPEPEDS